MGKVKNIDIELRDKLREAGVPDEQIDRAMHLAEVMSGVFDSLRNAQQEQEQEQEHEPIMFRIEVSCNDEQALKKYIKHMRKYMKKHGYEHEES